MSTSITITKLSNNKLVLMAARVSSPLHLPPGVVEWVGFVPGQEKEPGTARRRPIVFVLDVEYLARWGEATEAKFHCPSEMCSMLKD